MLISKILSSVISSLFILSSFHSMDNCDSQERRDNEVVNEQQKVYAINQPIPKLNYSLTRDNLIQILKMKSEARNTTSVSRAQGTGNILWWCPSIGFPIQADTQLTNPLQVLYGSASAVVEQPEPDGVFSSKNTDATYVLCVGKGGKIAPRYSEMKIEVFTTPVEIKDGQINFLDGDSSMPIIIKN